MTDSKSRCVVEISTDTRPIVYLTINRLSTDHRPTIDRLSIAISTAMSTATSTDISVDITHSKQDHYCGVFVSSQWKRLFFCAARYENFAVNQQDSVFLSCGALGKLYRNMVFVKSQKTPEKESRVVLRNPSYSKPQGKQTA